MNYIDILGEPLKSDFLIDLFETYDVDVIYTYDRTHENMEDEYRCGIPDMGLEFIFDGSQKLTTLFMTKIEHSGHNPFEGDDPRMTPFQTADEAMRFARTNSIDAMHQEANEDSFLGAIPEWVKFTFDNHSIHYQFDGTEISGVTLQILNT